MRRTIAYLLIFGGGGLFWAAVRPTPRPVSAAVASPPYDPQVTENNVRFWERRVASDPQGALGGAKLASAYLERFREQGDETDLLRAESAAEASCKRLPNRGALAALGSARLSQHQFEGAAQAARQLRQLDPESLTATYQLAEVAIERGNYDSAEHELISALHLDRNDPYGMTLRARLQEIHGKPEAALLLYRQAVDEAEHSSELPAPVRAWFRSRVAACLAAQGRLAEARDVYTHALDAFPRDQKSLVALGRLALEEGALDEAQEQLTRAEGLFRTQETALLHIDLLRAQGKADAAKRELTALVEGKGIAHAHPRALALGLADQGVHTEKAVGLARADVALRGDIYSHDTLAWALYAAGQKAEARVELEKALATGSKDVLLQRHARVIQGTNP